MVFDVDKFKSVAYQPKDSAKEWLQSAKEAVPYLWDVECSGEKILYALAGDAYVWASLALTANLKGCDLEELRDQHLDPDHTWSIEHGWSGAKKDELSLLHPFADEGAMEGGEQLVFRRSFDGVDVPIQIEISQRLIHALGLHWLDEENAYCFLNEEGDIEPVIRYIRLTSGKRLDHVVVTIKARELEKYMVATQTSLVVRFDFTRTGDGTFHGWHLPGRIDRPADGIIYHAVEQAGASFALGLMIIPATLTAQTFVEEDKKVWSDDAKEYATYKAFNWKSEKNEEISCAPTALASYFERDSPLPYQVTPAFFKPEVLDKYKANPEKYNLDHRSVTCRGSWYLKTFDVNEAGQVHTYLCYLGGLPYSEQQYWLAFNEWPKGPISKRAYETDIQGRFTSIRDPLLELKAAIAKLDANAPAWWKSRGDGLARAVHYPITTSPEQWAIAIMALDQLLIEGFLVKDLRARMIGAGITVDEKWQSIKLLRECMVADGMAAEDSTALIQPLKNLHDLRTTVKGHSNEREKQALVKSARKDFGSLRDHFVDLVSKCERSFAEITQRLESTTKSPAAKTRGS